MKLGTLVTGLSLIAISATAHAEREGHGGRVWQCTKTDGSTSIELMDYQLGRDKWDLTFAPGEGTNEIEIADNLLARLAKVEPARAEAYSKCVHGFMNRVKFSQKEILDLGDVKETIEKPDESCLLKQVVHQLPPVVDRIAGDDAKYKFIVTQNTWDSLDAQTKAGIMLHECRYETDVFEGNEFSDNTMYLTALTASTKMASTTPDQWRAILADLKESYYFGNFVLDADSVKATEVQVQSGKIRITAEQDRNTVAIDGTPAKVGDEIQFANDGNVATAKLWRPGQFQQSGTPYEVYGKVVLSQNGQLLAAENATAILQSEGAEIRIDGPAAFYPAGGLKFAPMTNTAKIMRGGKVIEIGGLHTTRVPWERGPVLVVLGEQGRVLSARLAKNAKLRMASRKKHSFEENDQVYFTEDGKVAANGIYSLQASENFIRLISIGRNLAFGFCSITAPEDCQRIGKTEGYEPKDLMKALKLSARDELKWPSRIVDWSYDHPLVTLLGDIALDGIAVAATLAAPVVAPPVIISTAVGVGSVPFVGMAYSGHTGQSRVIKHIVKTRYELIDEPIDEVRTELEKSLANLN